MRICPGSIKLLLAFALCIAPPARAEVLTANVASVKSGAGTLQGVRMTLDWPQGASSGTLHIQARSLDFPAISYATRQVDWQCPLQRAGATWKCAGSVRVANSAPQRLAVTFAPERKHAALAIGRSAIGYTSEAAVPDRHRVELDRVPVAWLKEFLAGLWEQGQWTQGTLGGRVDVMTPANKPFEVRTDLNLASVSVETPDGLLAAASLGGNLKADYRELRGVQRVDARFIARGGELLFNSFYAKLPTTPVSTRIVAERSQASPWRLPEIQWRDPGVLSANGKAQLDAQASVASLDLGIAIADLAVARDRYLNGFLAPAGFADLVLAGAMDAELELRNAKLSELSASFKQVNAVDSKARFTFAGIDGNLRWTSASAPVTSRLRWNSGALFAVGLGPAAFSLSSSDGQLRLLQAVPVNVLEGKVTLDHLRWTAPVNEAGAKLQFGATVDSLDLASLSQRLGWPAFTGTVGGKIPSARLESDVLTLDGGVQMNLFDGSIELKNLAMERPFGVAPTLSADVVIDNLDLDPMTRVLDFGSITGRLDGRISDLRLVDWQPVAFDARLETDRKAPGKRRISQRAVNNISNVGGSGVAAGLQAQALKFFDDFGYEQIGIGCKLADNICTMDGISSAGQGYIIVAGAGLPRIQVVGFRRKVDWPTLVSRLEAATEGQAPVIQ